MCRSSLTTRLGSFALLCPPVCLSSRPRGLEWCVTQLEDGGTRALRAIVRYATEFGSHFPDGHMPILCARNTSTAPAATTPHRLELELTNCQLTCMLALMFIAGLPEPDATEAAIGCKMPPLNGLSFLLASPCASDRAKLLMILTFFDNHHAAPPIGQHRVCRQPTPSHLLTEHDWAHQTAELGQLEVTDTGLIEEDPTAIQVDFANCSFGGGVLWDGNAQEECRLASAALLLPFIAICPFQEPDEALQFYGVLTTAHGIGFGNNLRFKSRALAPATPSRTILVAMDALEIMTNRLDQYATTHQLRELRKASAAFDVAADRLVDPQRRIIATGNWGCGIFGGDRQLKALLQWMAASALNYDLRYHTFDQTESAFGRDLRALARHVTLQPTTVAQLWQALQTSLETSSRNLLARILKHLQRSE
ncbi:uncharacterized protein MONBRDRAFT_33864 [Monosiga brevicollis MX1]|uniref:PARG catalytic Macro domain-containing protein n=1 Tax=Monosiga brevicollis TaxID=81824 RepID=A9V804_MONBE|nr:uncharacterized protein MONBRDRAFT_33864 [Monosiga brevicollis MX1]EDQ86467.1 predicted protein [Monosiga brevicollis MX1]|eukprot:XP_001748857.1 hypothetical protein [Monosiga brevicollis MX1]